MSWESRHRTFNTKLYRQGLQEYLSVIIQLKSCLKGGSMHQWNPLKELWSQKEDGWCQQGHQELIFRSMCPSIFYSISPLLIFLTSVSSLFHLTNCGHNRFCWLALFLLLQKHVFMNKTPDGRKTIPAITVHCNFDTFCSQMFLSGGGEQKREIQ